MTKSDRISDLVRLGYSQSVAKKISEERPDLAENPEPPVVAYRGLSGRTYDPTSGNKTAVVVSRPPTERAIRKAQEFALGVIWGNTNPSPDGYYTIVEYQLPRKVLDRKGDYETDSFERQAVPNESLFVSRVGSFHLREHAPMSPIEWHEPGDDAP